MNQMLQRPLVVSYGSRRHRYYLFIKLCILRKDYSLVSVSEWIQWLKMKLIKWIKGCIYPVWTFGHCRQNFHLASVAMWGS